MTPDGASFTDVRDERASYECTWDFGDGSPAQVIPACLPDSPGDGVSHVYESSGRYSLTLRVECEDGRSGEALTTVVVGQPSD